MDDASKNRDKSILLQRDFNEGVLRKKRGQGGRDLSYVPSWAVIERLNEVLGVGGWSWRLVSRERDGDAVVVFGELLALGQVFSGEDCAEIMKAKAGGFAPDALANAWKGAASGAFVRAARLLGVGTYLYRKGDPSEVELDEREERRAVRSKPAKATMDRIFKLGTELGWTGERFRYECGGKSSSELSSEEAVVLLASLEAATKGEVKP
jgi:hypothetical protein